MGYLWLKALHVISVIAWMAGMLYLPRLFVYHASAVALSDSASVFSTMEAKLLRFIMAPALIAVWASGLALALWGGFYGSGWLHAKIALVLGMSGLHGYFSACARRFRAGENRNSSRFYRAINEAPTLLMILIVILVVVKPF